MFQHSIAKFHPNPANYSALVELSPPNTTSTSTTATTPTSKNNIKICGFDFDHTLVRPLNHRKLPTSWDDYEIIPNALENIKTLINNFHYIPVIFTNQLGASNGKSAYDIAGFADRCNKFMTEFKAVVGVEPFIYVAHYDDKYRKPLPFMWNFAVDDMNNYFAQNNIHLSSAFYEATENITTNKNITTNSNIFNKSFYCGDMYGGYELGSMGRHILTKSGDLLFAKNNNINFAVAEFLFEPYNSTNTAEYYDRKYFVRADNNWSNPNISVKIDVAKEYKCGSTDYTTELAENTEINKTTISYIGEVLDDLKWLFGHELFVIVLSGSPGAGKSSFAGQILKKVFTDKGFGEMVLLSRDDFKTDSQYFKECVSVLSSGKHIIIDKTNSTVKQRNDIRDKVIAAFMKKSGANIEKLHLAYIKVSTSKDLVMRLNNIRYGYSVPDVAIHTYYKKMEPFQESDIIPVDNPIGYNNRPKISVIYNKELKFSFDTLKEFGLFNREIADLFGLCW